MNFRTWQAEYHPILADIKVRETLEARAMIVARYTFKVLAAREKKGFGVWRMVSLKPCDCAALVPHTTGPACIEPCNGNDATCIWHGDHAALSASATDAQAR